MDFKIIVDSVCDITPHLLERLGVTKIPLTLRLGRKEYTDDENLDLEGFMAEMSQSAEKAGTAAPSPHSFKNAIESAARSFVVTVSSQLSGAYSAARLGKEYAEANGVTDVHVFDSKTASAGQLLIAVKIRELISKKIPMDQIIQTVNGFIDSMKTYLVLERYDNLIKNGRLNKITGRLINILGVKLVLGADGEGNISMHGITRGKTQMLEKFVSLIKASGRPTSGENVVISHCNNLPLASQLKGLIAQRFDFKEIFVVPTGGVSSLYADNRGIIMAF